MAVTKDVIHYSTKWTIRKFDGDEDMARRYFGGDTDAKPYEVSEFDGNVLLNEGIAILGTLLIGTGGTAYSNAAAYIGVGDSATAAAATDTGLIASTNKAWAGQEAGYPTVASQVVTWRSVFGTSAANYAWNEFTVVNATTDTGDNLNRKVSSQGTKASGQTWTVDVAITFS